MQRSLAISRNLKFPRPTLAKATFCRGTNHLPPNEQTNYDFRSDTVTKPSQSMRAAMFSAEVGDDVYNEDPTVNRLQERVAELTGHEAGLFCVSATMANQLAARTHLKAPPYSSICDARSHVFNYEASGIAFHCGALMVPIEPQGERCHITADDIQKKLVVDDDIHHAPTKLISLENTLDGEIFPIDEIRKISDLAKSHDIPIHLDGARLWNVTVATKISLRTWCQPFDSVSLCFSKGLGAPMGAMLVGSHPFIKKAKHFRKLYGGGWRQAGIQAAAANISLDENWPAMETDHENARYLGESLEKLGLRLTRRVDTNMVWAEMPCTGDELQMAVAKRGLRVFGGDDKEMRFVIHSQTPRKAVEELVAGIRDYLQKRDD